MKPETVEAKLSNIHYGKWTHSSNEEMWPLYEGFDTKEKAIADGQRNYEGDPFWVGVMGKPVVPTIDGYEIRERLGDMMADSESSWPDQPEWPLLNLLELGELEDAVNGAIKKFLEDKKAMPDWFVVEQSEEITPLEKALS